MGIDSVVWIACVAVVNRIGVGPSVSRLRLRGTEQNVHVQFRQTVGQRLPKGYDSPFGEDDRPRPSALSFRNSVLTSIPSSRAAAVRLPS